MSTDAARYVVTVERCDRGDPSSSRNEYLTAIRYDRYQTGNTNTHNSSPFAKDGFVFSSICAAEMAAVFVGGRVEDVVVARMRGDGK